MLNRDMIIVTLKQPFVDWINEVDPDPDGSRMTLADANEDLPAFLINDYACGNLRSWLEQHYGKIFRELLGQWCAIPARWPQPLTLELFDAWCGIEPHSLIFDLVDAPLVNDGFNLSFRLRAR